MSNSTTVTIVGNLTADPEERSTRNGETVTQFSVASSRRWKNKNNEWEEETSYFDIVAWSELAKNVVHSLHKGNRAVIIGRLEQQSWEDKKTGDKRSKIVVIAEDIGPSLRTAYTPEVVKTTGKAKSTSATQRSFDDEEPF